MSSHNSQNHGRVRCVPGTEVPRRRDVVATSTRQREEGQVGGAAAEERGTAQSPNLLRQRCVEHPTGPKRVLEAHGAPEHTAKGHVLPKQHLYRAGGGTGVSGGGGDGVGTLPTFKEESQALWLNVQPCPNKHNDTGLLHGSPGTPRWPTVTMTWMCLGWL
jgi:hypothetical protein